jgi:DNA-binding PadR family transcriptional regulator
MILHRYLHSRGDDCAEPRFFRHGHGKHGFGRRFGQGGPRRRGDIKFELLGILAEGPRHGYDLMLEVERRTGMKPSPGSVYPTLQALEEGGFLKGRDDEGKRVYEITESGRALLADRSEPTESADDEQAGAAPYARAMLAGRSVISASREVLRSGDVTLVTKVAEILERTRREIYTLLASSE